MGNSDYATKTKNSEKPPKGASEASYSINITEEASMNMYSEESIMTSVE